MARIRTIKPDFWTDEKIVELSMSARLLFIGLWNFCDDEGRMQYSTKKIKMQIFPADNIDTHELLTELAVIGVIDVYAVEDKEYIQISNWKKHQAVNRPTASKHPDKSKAHGVLNVGREREREREGKGKLFIESLAAKHSSAEKLSTAPENPPLTNTPEVRESAPPPPPHKPPNGQDAITARALELTIMLRKRGAAVQASDPNLRKWAQSGVTDAQALQALETATQRRSEKCSTQPINSGYLDSILESRDDPTQPEKRKRTGPPWWSSNDLMIAKAAEIGVKPPKPGESWETFRGRINAELAKSESTA